MSHKVLLVYTNASLPGYLSLTFFVFLHHGNDESLMLRVPLRPMDGYYEKRPASEHWIQGHLGFVKEEISQKWRRLCGALKREPLVLEENLDLQLVVFVTGVLTH